MTAAAGERRARLVAVHPFLFAAFPILFLLRENLWGVRLGEVVVPLVATLLSVGAIQVGLGLLTRKPRKVAVVLSVFALLFFSYGHIWRSVTDARGQVFGLDGDIVLGTMATVVLGLTSLTVVRTNRPLVDLTRVANVVALAMVATVVVPLGSYVVSSRAFAAPPTKNAAATIESNKATDRPDIYYFILDRYAGARTLEEMFAFDNEEFLGELEERGFQIAREAHANYQNTTFSLGSTLNMRHLDWLQKEEGGPKDSRIPVYGSIQRSGVARFLRDQGYRYVHMGNRWDMTRESPIADVNIRMDRTSEFTRVFAGSTALLPGMRRGVLGPEETDGEETARRIHNRQFQEIERIKNFRGPKYVFAHLGLTHPPYVLDRNGRPVHYAENLSNHHARARAYLELVKLTNRRILDTVDSLLAVPASKRPVIVLASDEGPYPGFGRGYNPWWRAADAHLRTKFRIFLAMHLPGAEGDEVYPALSPVNMFRVVFNEYFDADMALLEDRSYVSYSKKDAYRWIDITARLEESDAPVGSPRYPPYVTVLPPIRRAT